MSLIKEGLVMIETKIRALVKLGEWIKSKPDKLSLAKLKSERANPWFTQHEQDRALDALTNHFLVEEVLSDWVQHYPQHPKSPKVIGLIFAGNLPLVGFHDWLSVFLTGHYAHIKLSSKDEFLFPAMMEFLFDIHPEWEDQTAIGNKLKTIDAVIATGSNNSNRYFEYYFGHLPHIFRGHRNGIAVLPENVSNLDLKKLGEDVFAYFGLGCRSVSMCLVPKNFNVDRLFDSWAKFKYIRNHSKWDNNYRYNYSIFAMNNESFLTDGVLIIKEDEQISSRIACLHLKTYNSKEELHSFVSQNLDRIQVVAGRERFSNVDTVDFGMTQKPKLTDYADQVDTMQFLSEL
jgi:hypothetical protein